MRIFCKYFYCQLELFEQKEIWISFTAACVRVENVRDIGNFESTRAISIRAINRIRIAGVIFGRVRIRDRCRRWKSGRIILANQLNGCFYLFIQMDDFVILPKGCINICVMLYAVLENMGRREREQGRFSARRVKYGLRGLIPSAASTGERGHHRRSEMIGRLLLRKGGKFYHFPGIRTLCPFRKRFQSLNREF